jgi:alkylhydroperoxidase family enzyme
VLQALVRDYATCPLPEREKQVLRFGLLCATDPLSITDADYAALRGHDLNDEEIFEIVATAALFSSINSYTDSAGVPIDQLG